MLSKLRYLLRVLYEKHFYRNNLQVHDLPPIFHYWSNRYLRPMFEAHGFSSPDHFFERSLVQLGQQHGNLKVLSIGSGNGELEIHIAQSLQQAGVGFELECLDLNPHMLQRAREAAQQAGVLAGMRFTQGDFNRLELQAEHYDAILANQSLHHVLELERLFEQVHAALQPHGQFLTSDMIGRNGHMRWPEALEAMRPFWQELPPAYRYNRLLRRQEDEFINHDCSTHGFEGIRAQDILPLLLRHFQFELFLPHGNIIFPFVDRAFGHNFNAEAEWDRDFIDRVHAADQAGILHGRLKPCSMLAILRRRDIPPVQTRLADPRLTPAFCVRPPED